MNRRKIRIMLQVRLCVCANTFFYDGLCWQQRRRLPFRLDNREGVTTREEWVKWEEVAFRRYGFTLMELLRARVKECCVFARYRIIAFSLGIKVSYMEEFSVSSVVNLHCDFFATFVAIKQMLNLIPEVFFKSNEYIFQ